MKIGFFDVKPYDIEWFDKFKGEWRIQYFESKLNPTTAIIASGCEVVIAFVNDDIGVETIDALVAMGVKAIALRCAGYNNVDVRHAAGKLKIYRVPAYSPSAVAEHAIALLMALNRKIHRAYNRVRDYNFGLSGLTGFVMKGKTVGVIGTGRIGQEFIKICEGFGMRAICVDPYKVEGLTYVGLEELLTTSDVISLHCPLTMENYRLINKRTISMMKDGVYIINTSRGALIDAEALLEALKSEKVAGAGLDVYEEESEFFYEDMSGAAIKDDVLKLLIATPNVILTSHQAFLTTEALSTIAQTTMKNIEDFLAGKETANEVSLSQPSV